MASIIAQHINSHTPFITIVGPKSAKRWRDFNLCAGHIYGYHPLLERKGYNGLFVVSNADIKYDEDKNSATYGEPKSARLFFYLCKQGRDYYEWSKHSFSNAMSNPVGRMMVNKLCERNGGVVLDTSIKSFYNPRLVTGDFQPMPNMRIPMGCFNTVISSKSTVYSKDSHVDVVVKDVYSSKHYKNTIEPARKQHADRNKKIKHAEHIRMKEEARNS